MDKAILAPAAVLVFWTLLILLWMAVTRFAGIAKSGLDVKAAPPGGRGADLEAILPASTNWKSHNYTHLMEQPTIFYAVIFILFLAGAATPLMISFAWAYTAFRIAHSLWQVLVNTVIPVRFGLFVLATVCLLVLSVNALMATL